MAIVAATLGHVQSVYAKSIPPKLPKSIEQMPAVKFIRIPGIVNPVALDQPIYPGSFFTWREATKDGTRIPRDTWFDGRLVKASEITQNIILLAHELDEIRERFGNHPITINSWYRPPEANSRTPGAAKNSIHQLGLAADIVIYNHGSFRVCDRLHREGWEGGLGRYINRTHIDIRQKLGMPAARWDG
jgi:hypothetical protein